MAEPNDQVREKPFALDQYLVEMRDLLDVRSMYVYLISTEPQCLTHEEANQLERYHNDRSQLVRKLVEFINRRGSGGVDGFLQALARSVDHGINPGHGDLLQILEDAKRRRPRAVSTAKMDPPPSEVIPSTVALYSTNGQFKAVFTLDSRAEQAGFTLDSRAEKPVFILGSGEEQHEVNPDKDIESAIQVVDSPPMDEGRKEAKDTTNNNRQTSITILDIKPHSWRTFLTGMACSALVAAGIALFVYAVRGFQEDKKACDLGAPYSFSAFTLMAAFLCLTLPILLFLRLLYQFVKEYARSPQFARKCMKFVSVKLAWVFLAIYVVVLVGQIVYSVYIAVFAYGKFADWRSDKKNCTNTTFIAAFSSLTSLYILLLVVLVVLAWYLVNKYLRGHAQTVITLTALPLFSNAH